MSLPIMPTINASLNGLSGVFLMFGFLAIKRRDSMTHRKWMMAAFTSSTRFLCAYVYYHATTHLLTRYQGHGIWRTVYFLILGTHTPLAVLIVQFIIMAPYVLTVILLAGFIGKSIPPRASGIPYTKDR